MLSEWNLFVCRGLTVSVAEESLGGISFLSNYYYLLYPGPKTENNGEFYLRQCR